MVATVPIELLNSRFPINEFRFASQAGPLTTGQTSWSDIGNLILNFDENDRGKFLVTLTIPGLSDNASSGIQQTNFRLVLRTGSGQDTPLGEGSWSSTDARQVFSFCLACEADVASNKKASAIVAQWRLSTEGSATIIEGLSSLSAVGSLELKKVAFTDTHHFEYPELFSRGLRLTNYSEVLFLTGYSSTAEKGNTDIIPLTADLQMQWIVDHLDNFFAKIPYADSTGFYSKYDIVYFDLVIDKTVDITAQNAVLKVLENWFGPQKSDDPNVPDKLEVIPRPSTGILKKVEALAFPSTKVEIEFILAH